MSTSRKKLVVLGSTGSVGRNVMDVVQRHAERFEVVGMATGRRVELLARQCESHPRARFSVGDADAHGLLLKIDGSLDSRSTGVGSAGMTALIERCAPDLVVNCLVGFVGLEPTLAALRAGVPVALANKEAVVTGGGLIAEACDAGGSRLVPIDSEHVAISQCLQGTHTTDVKKVYLTASGGALRDHPLDGFGDVTPETVLSHPTWDMGEKITVDSATLMNKGLEVIEAHFLFDLPFDRIDVVVHPQSIVHSLVEFRDNSILAQMGVPDMRLPILYALTYPEKVDTEIAASRITDFPTLSFEPVDPVRYPCFALAVDAGREGGNRPTVLNCANEVAVGSFLANRVPFPHIYRIIRAALDGVPNGEIRCFDDVVETDRRTRTYIRENILSS